MPSWVIKSFKGRKKSQIVKKNNKTKKMEEVKKRNPRYSRTSITWIIYTATQLTRTTISAHSFTNIMDSENKKSLRKILTL